MTPEHAATWNSAIEASIKAYPNGIGAILELKKKFVVTVEHIGRSTKQDVDVVDG